MITLKMKRVFLLIIASCIINAVMAWNGSGTEAEPYRIESNGDLSQLANYVNSGTSYSGIYIKLVYDLDLSTVCGPTIGSWTPIGSSNAPFEGVFDGDGHTISGLYVNNNSDYQGLFGYVTAEATITNITLISPNVTGGNYVGGICGSGQASYCAVAGGSVRGSSVVGGLVGFSEGSVNHCFNMAKVTATGSSTTLGYSGAFVGGLVGFMHDEDSDAELTYCYNVGLVEATAYSANYVGGLVGFWMGTNNAFLSESYNAGQVISTSDIYVDPILGGCSGEIYPENCCFDKQMCTCTFNEDYAFPILTIELVADMFFGDDENWVLEENLYPRLVGFEDSDAAKVSAAPLFLYYDENDWEIFEDASHVSTNFAFSTENGISWTSNHPNIVSIGNDDNAILHSDGSVDLTASFNGINKVVPIIVERPSFQISSASDLWQFSQSVQNGNTYAGQTIELTADISLLGYNWVPIGTRDHPFSGDFNGNGHVINDLYINNTDPNVWYQGLFGYARNADIHDLTLRGEVTSAGLWTAAFCAYAISDDTEADHAIYNCINYVNVNGYIDTGGICGNFQTSTAKHFDIYGCLNYGNITATSERSGGIVGSCDYGNLYNETAGINLTRCANFGYLNGRSGIGGICGYFYCDNENAGISYCYNMGDIYCNSNGNLNVTYALHLGGVAGFMGLANSQSQHSTKIEHCFNAGQVAVSKMTPYAVGYGPVVGGLNTPGVPTITAVNCYYDNQMCTMPSSQEIDGITGLSTSEMTGSSMSNYLGNQHWTYTNGFYPRFASAPYSQVFATPIFLANGETIDNVLSNFTLGQIDNNFTWASSDPSIISINGTVATINNTEDLAEVTLTGTWDGVSKSVNIKVNNRIHGDWTVTYAANSATGEVPVDSNSPYFDGNTITVLAPDGLTNPGRRFTGWQWFETGIGNHIAQPGDQIVIHQNITFTAQWVNEFTVTYFANGATSGTAPIDSNTYLLHEIATILGQCDLLKTNCRFDGWRKDSGNGQIVREGDQLTIMGNVTLFANWVNTYPVLYFANNATGGTVPVDENRYALYEQAVVMDNVGGLYKDGCVFTGWRTSSSLYSGVHYNVGQNIIINNGPVYLYAEFTPLYTLTYDANDATSGTVPVDPNSPYLQNAIATVLDNTGNLTRDGYCWYGWNTATNGNGVHYEPSSQFSIQTNTNLFADWRYRITYDANGATSGTVPEDDVWHLPSSMAHALDNTGGLAKENCFFNGWNTEPDGSGTHYPAGYPIYTYRNTTLYAEWTSILSTMEDVQAITNTNPNNTYHINVDGWQVTFAHPYYNNNSYVPSIFYPTAYFTDGQGHGIMACATTPQSLGFNAGDCLSGIVSCKVIRNASGYNVIRGLNSTTAGLTVTNDGTSATSSTTTIGDIGMAQLGALVRIEDVSSHRNGSVLYFDDMDDDIACFYISADGSPFPNHDPYPNTTDGQLFDMVTGVVLYQYFDRQYQLVIYPLSDNDVVAHPYSITLNQAAHGTLTCEHNEAFSNEYVNISVEVDDDYELYALNVYKADEPSVTVTINQSNNNNYYFLMPTYDVIVEPQIGTQRPRIYCNDYCYYFDFYNLEGQSIGQAQPGEWIKMSLNYFNNYGSYEGPETFALNYGENATVDLYLSPEATTPTDINFCYSDYYFQMPASDITITATINRNFRRFFLNTISWEDGLMERRERYALCYNTVTLPEPQQAGYTFDRYYITDYYNGGDLNDEYLEGNILSIPYNGILEAYALMKKDGSQLYAIDNATNGIIHYANIDNLRFHPEEAPSGASLEFNVVPKETQNGGVTLPVAITITPDDASIEPTTFYIDPKEFDPYESFHYTMPASDVTITANTGTYYKLYQVNTSGSFNLQSLYYVLDRTLYATANEQIALSDYLAEWDATFYEYEILDTNGNPRSDLLVDGILTMPAESIVIVCHYYYDNYTYNVSIDPEISNYITITSILPAAEGTRVTFTTRPGLSFYSGYELGVVDNWGNPLPCSPAYSPDINEYYFYISEDVTIAPVEIPKHWVTFFDSYGNDPDDWGTRINEDSKEYTRGSIINITPREYYGFTFVGYEAIRYDYYGSTDITSQVLSGNPTDGYTLTMPDYQFKLWGRYIHTPGFQYKITYAKWLSGYDIEMAVPVVEYAEAGETVTFSFPDDYSYARFLPGYGFSITQDVTNSPVGYENNTFTMPYGDVTVRGFYELTDPIVLVRVNGELKVVVPTEEEGGAKAMAENNSIDLTPYVPSEAPAPGFEFYKWYKNVGTADFFYYDSYWEPNRCIEDTYTPNMFEDDDIITFIDAVFFQPIGMFYQGFNSIPTDDTLAIIGNYWIYDEDDPDNSIDNYYGLNGNAIPIMLALDEEWNFLEEWDDANQQHHSMEEVLWIVESTDDGFRLRHKATNNYLAIDENQVTYAADQNGAHIFHHSMDDYGNLLYFKVDDDTHLEFDTNHFYVANDEDFHEDDYYYSNVFFISKQKVGKNFTSQIKTDNEDDYINEFQGVHIIEGEVYANYLENYYSSGLIIIKDGGVLYANQGIFNDNPEAIIIEDGGQLVHNYDDGNLKATVQKHVTGYGNRSADWQLIALPLYFNEDNPLNYPINDFAVGDYDLYGYDEPTRYWINAKDESNETPLATLERCIGYLYANADDTDLSFSGWMTSMETDRPIAMLSSEGEGDLNGFNLVGNPYTYNIKPEDLCFARAINEDEYSFTNDVRTIYKLNGSNAIAAQGNDAIIKPCEGFFVKATADDEVLQFYHMYRSAKANPMRFLKIEVEQQNHGRRPQLDRAYLNFNAARNVEKLVLDKTATRISLVSEGKDYAALSTSNEGTMPLSFEAAQNGIYTLTVSAERTEMAYLHLVDKLTGADIDLLESGSYTFMATSSDDAMRFEIVFKTK